MVQSEINSYSSVYALGHRVTEGMLDDEVLVEEKIDGSQFSFGKSLLGGIECRSKGADVFLDNPEKMFEKAVETVKTIGSNLREGLIYRCEYLSKPKHNVLNYSRVPKNHLIVFDIDRGNQCYLSPEEKAVEASRIGLEVVPVLFKGKIGGVEEFKDFLARESILGGTKIEGVVIKNYNRFTPDKKTLMAKYVSEEFKESHKKEWNLKDPAKSVEDLLIQELRTEARWQKSVQHLKELGLLTNTPKDIGILIKAIAEDIETEESDYVKERLYKAYWPKIRRALTYGFPEWYKEQLLKNLFEKEE